MIIIIPIPKDKNKNNNEAKLNFPNIHPPQI